MFLTRPSYQIFLYRMTAVNATFPVDELSENTRQENETLVSYTFLSFKYLFSWKMSPSRLCV